jgi:hypothetical protein
VTFALLRLIYLSLKFEEPEFERNKLRRAINDCWKAIYHSLGKNKDKPLDDDRFLLTHYFLYFVKPIYGDPSTVDDVRYRRLYRTDYASALLEKLFIASNVSKDAPDDVRVTLSSIYRYVSSLQDAVESWYKIFNPFDSDFSSDAQMWLDKLNRIGMDSYLPLILVYLQKVTGDSKVVGFLQAVERHRFVHSLLERSYRPYSSGTHPKMLELAIELNTGKTNAERVTRHIVDDTISVSKSSDFIKEVQTRFRTDGFYEWSTIRYFLFEYNLDLQERSTTTRAKIFWPEFTEPKEDFISVEHIYPQHARHDYWTSRFGGLTQKQRTTLRNSLGNLLPLSKPKNASLSNRPFHEKVNGKGDSTASYRYGCYAENEVAKYAEWTPANVLARGQAMLSFMEKRWGLDLGGDKPKTFTLGLDFLSPP